MQYMIVECPKCNTISVNQPECPECGFPLETVLIKPLIQQLDLHDISAAEKSICIVWLTNDEIHRRLV